MIVEPYKIRPLPAEVGLLGEDGQVIAETGEAFSPRATPKGLQVWASADTVLGLLREGRGRALCWRSRPIRYAPSGVDDFRVRVLDLPFPSGPDALAGLVLWREWLASYGAAPSGSLGSSSMSLLRATLKQTLWTSMPFASAPPVRFTLGARQELGPAGSPAEYEGALSLHDMRAAYASTLAGLWYGGHWFRLHEGKAAEHAELAARVPGRLVFCRARVKLAGSRPGPLVKRPRSEPAGQLGFYAEYPVSGSVQGVWTWEELEAAREHGARVRVLDGWLHVSQTQPFQPWWRAVEDGRQMRGFPGMLAKATGNSLWGQFCIRHAPGLRGLLYYTAGGRRVFRELPSRAGRRPAHDLSEFLTGVVRARLYDFCVRAGDQLCSAHTDGAWVVGVPPEAPGWRLKERADRLRVLDPQFLAYRRPGEEEERYVVSGWPAEGAGELFEEQWHRRERRQAA